MAHLIREIEVINEGVIKHPILSNGQGWDSSEYSGRSVLESGRDSIMMGKIIQAINKASSLVCLQSYLIQHTEIIDSLSSAFKRGVKVYILSSVDARIKDSIEEEGDDFIKASYLKMLNDNFKNKFIFRTAENFHAKFILIDPKNNPKGFLCTNNFTRKGFTRNQELAVELSREQCIDLYKLFVFHFWEYSTDELNDTDQLDKVKPAGKFKLEGINSILYTSPNGDTSLFNELLEAIKGAQESITISSFNIEKDNELMRATIDKAKIGIKVTLFCRLTEKLYNNQLKHLADNGIIIYVEENFHAKTLLVDGKKGFLFTANYTEMGLKKGFEVGIKLNDKQVVDLQFIQDKWAHFFKNMVIQSEKIININVYEIFKDGELKKKVLLEEMKEQRRKITKVSDLISFYEEKLQLNDSGVKKQKIKIVAEFNPPPESIAFLSSFPYQLLTYKNDRGLDISFILLHKIFNGESLSELNQHQDLMIFMF
jgi:phosphatidylserine/phosphatidylglycerophosphate/cardiolipin synthase-like enzyme